VAHESRVTPLGDGRYAIDGERRQLAYAVRHGNDTWVFIDGRTYVLSASAPSARAATRHVDHSALAAPMPATVVAVNAAPGQQVKAGDVLVTLEAMKMELAIKAPRDGVVRTVKCQAGELVQPGVPLVELS
jgi:3-methylcrotonyl-CoA carboxylase alpha subunit